MTVPTDYSTIQAAISAANPGDVIRVGPGTYTEVADLNGTAGLTIVGDPGDGTRGPGPNAPVLVGGFDIDETNTGTTVAGFVVDQADGYAFEIEIHDGTTLDGVTIRDNEITGRVEFEVGAEASLQNGLVADNVFPRDPTNMIRVGAGGADVSDLRIEGNEMTGGRTLSIETSTTDGKENLIDIRHDGAGATGSYVIVGNVLSDSNNDGVEFTLAEDGTYDITVRCNDITDTEDSGIEFLKNGGSGMTARTEYNTIEGPEEYCFEVRGGSAAGHIVRNNNFVSGELGLVYQFTGEGTLDARRNWWGESGQPTVTGVDTSDPLTGPTSGCTETPVEPEDEDIRGRFDVTSAWMEPRTIAPGEPVTVVVTVENIGNGPGRFAGTMHDGFDCIAPSQYARLGPGEQVTLTYTVTFDGVGDHSVMLRTNHLGTVTVVTD